MGKKAAEYVIRQMPTEFGYDCSKGEWGNHQFYQNTPQYFKENAETAVTLSMEGFLHWLLHIPHAYGIPESKRYRFPRREPEELSEAYVILMMTEKKTKEVWEKIDAIVGCMIQSPLVLFECKVDIFNFHAKRKLETQDWEGKDGLW